MAKFGKFISKNHLPISEDEKQEFIKRISALVEKYDNYDAIEVSKVCEIPKDYDGIMGVPITFLDKYNPSQFEIVGCANNPIIKGKLIYKRLLIKRK